MYISVHHDERRIYGGIHQGLIPGSSLQEIEEPMTHLFPEFECDCTSGDYLLFNHFEDSIQAQYFNVNNRFQGTALEISLRLQISPLFKLPTKRFLGFKYGKKDHILFEFMIFSDDKAIYRDRLIDFIHRKRDQLAKEKGIRIKTRKFPNSEFATDEIAAMKTRLGRFCLDHHLSLNPNPITAPLYINVNPISSQLAYSLED